jgi:hypothetical protein
VPKRPLRHLPSSCRARVPLRARGSSRGAADPCGGQRHRLRSLALFAAATAGREVAAARAPPTADPRALSASSLRPFRRALLRSGASSIGRRARPHRVDKTGTKSYHPRSAAAFSTGSAACARGGVAEWLKAADCKSVDGSLRRFESYPLHQRPTDLERGRRRDRASDGTGKDWVQRVECGCSSMVELQPSKLATWVRFPSPAPAPAQKQSKHYPSSLKESR